MTQQISKGVGDDIGGRRWGHEQRRVADELVGVHLVRILETHLAHTTKVATAAAFG